jgi:hypothetical protein
MIRRTWSGEQLISYARLIRPGNRYKLSSVVQRQASWGGRQDIVIAPEQVVRVILGLDACQPRVVIAIGGSHPLPALVIHEKFT